MKPKLKEWLIKLGLKSIPLPEEREIKLGTIFNEINPRKLSTISLTRFSSRQYKYPINYICSSRYTIWNFIPKNLFEQFQRIANFYFLCIALIQLFIDSSVPIVLNVFPLIFVLTITMAKQGYEDYLRHNADRDINNIKVEVIKNGTRQIISSEDIQVGDLIICKDKEVFPCDILLLGSSDPSGECYVTTASLDGETNLKIFYSAPGNDCISSSKVVEQASINAIIKCEQPKPDLYQFVGQITWSDNPHKSHPISAQNMLLRGAKLCNTDFIVGVAIYTGPQTKMALNSCEKPPKFSSVELQLNNFLMIFLIVLLCSGLLCTIMKYTQARYLYTGDVFYVPVERMHPWRIVQTFFSFIVLLNYLIPISLYVTIELQKFFGSKFFDLDQEMYCEINNLTAKSNTSDLNEELGQIEYIFSDKTGTLTENEMVFRRCSINLIQYKSHSNILRNCKTDTTVKIDGDDKQLKEFFIVLALCHTVRVEVKPNVKQVDPEELVYQASSPDEKAFLEACRAFGIIFLGKAEDKSMQVMFGHENRQIVSYKVLDVLEFDSDRKRMSVILQSNDDSSSVDLLCKGAENCMLSQSVESSEIDYIMEHVEEYGREGLRTLVIGRRRMSLEKYTELSEQLSRARGHLQPEEREQMMRAALDALENDLQLIGCTGIEDRLQDDVERTITHLKQAGIQVWILTGDKEETAVNISKSTGHFSKDIREVQLTKQSDMIGCTNLLNSQLEGISCTPDIKYQLIIDGQTLTIILQNNLEDRLRELCHKAQSVLCCRMTPLQKSAVVRLVKYDPQFNGRSPITLAIGDGANDVSMILEAHVGIGVYGKEGHQAVRAADYAIVKFRHLHRVLLMHGQYYYWRLAILVQYFFYKNSAFIGPQLYYAFYSGFSAQTVYDSLYLILYNITLTTLPIFCYGLVEQHLSANQLMNQPQLYAYIRHNSKLTMTSFISWNLFGLWHGLVAMFGPVLLLQTNDIVRHNGHPLQFYGLGTVILMIIWITTSLKLCLVTCHYNWLFVASFIFVFIGNIGLFLLYQGVLWSASSGDMYWVWFNTLGEMSVWLCIIICISISLTPDILYKAIVNEMDFIRNEKQQSNFQASTNTTQTSLAASYGGGIVGGHSFDNGGFDMDGNWMTPTKVLYKNNNNNHDRFSYSNSIAFE